jgi:type II secretory pathway pseudopilin PulG
MEDKSRFEQWMDSLSDWLNDQQWFQQLKEKWEELDPQSRLYLQFAGAGVSVVGVILVLFSFYWSVHKTKEELVAKSELLSMMSNATDELRTLQAANSSLNVTGGTNEPWPNYFETTASAAGIPKTNLTVSDSKTGTSSEIAKETLYDLTMKKVSIRQAVRLAQSLESGPRPVKLRNLTIDTQPDGSGYLDATLSVSAFAMVSK